MTLCELGCGRVAIHIQKNGRHICDTWMSKCPAMKKKNGAGNKGRKCTWGDKLSASNKATKAKQNIIPWNKGLTKEEDPRIAKIAATLTGRRIPKIKLIPTTDPVYSDMKKYRNRIAAKSHITYKHNKHIINPNNLPLGRHGAPGTYQIDHIMSVVEGFKYNVPIELMASLENLQLLSWEENIKKYSKVDYSAIPNSIRIYLKETYEILTTNLLQKTGW